MPGALVPAVAAVAAAFCTAVILTMPAFGVLAPALGLAVAALCALVAVVDARTFTIPDGAVAALAGLAVVLRWAAGLATGQGTATLLPVLALDLALSAGALWAVREVFYRRRGVDVLGFGDVKLAGAAGLLVGAAGFAAALLAASLLGLVIAGGMALAGRRVDRSTKLPFGALLAPAVFAVWWMAGPSAVPL
ncbi:prepilin peptidase [Acuticoccus sp. I52.16.1]|uniref:prepilin peptidase n=1 Tax=Acuticoccus sp. I52.16.1 TaxID=2928472 RepID=UPI001FD2C3AA|nr:prepilin peptidase [Acuticoccus sp. I52.16.1]UOM34665.1 prepilin peptidase [Acuticoccus sp. I52.16.1]